MKSVGFVLDTKKIIIIVFAVYLEQKTGFTEENVTAKIILKARLFPTLNLKM